MWWEKEWVLGGCVSVSRDVKELEDGEGGEGGDLDLDLVDAMKKLDKKGINRVMKGLGEGRKRRRVFFF